MITMYLEPEEFKALDEIRWRERKGKGEIAREAILEYIKIHSDGNQSFTIDQFQDPDFQAVPALFRDRQTWLEHYQNSNEKERTQLRVKVIELQKAFRQVDINQ